MTVSEAAKKLLSVAENEVGYLEKATNAQLDDKTANAGRNNYTKYARDHAKWGTYNASKQGYAWCDMFVDWCFITAFGFSAGMEMTCQPKGLYGAGCTMSYNYFRNAGQSVPVSKVQEGDQIFFGSPGNMTHTGIVYKVDSAKIYTIEGNTGSGENTVIPNGGGVFKKWYYRNSAAIGGIGRPKWDVAAKISGIPEHSELKSVRYGSFQGGIFAEVPFSCIERMEHIRMDGARGEYLTSAAVRAKWNGRAPDIVINAELFNYSNYTPASGVVHHGELEYRGWQPFIGFSNYRTPIQEGYNAVSSLDAVGGYPALVLGGEKSFTVPKGLEGNRYRTAMGLKGDVLGILVTQNPVNLEVVANKFVSEGYDFAINLDGGSSSGYAIPSKAWARANKLRGFVGIWLKGGNGNYLSRSAAPVKPSKPAKTESWAETDKSAAKGVRMKVTASALNLRAGAGTSTAVKTVLKFGEVVTWYGYQTENWYYVRTAGGKEGYVSKQYVKRA